MSTSGEDANKIASSVLAMVVNLTDSVRYFDEHERDYYVGEAHRVSNELAHHIHCALDNATRRAAERR